MQFGRLGKVVAVGTMAALMGGSAIAFAQLQNFPAPFIADSSVNTLVVVGESAHPEDVVASIDIAARLGGEVTTDVAVPGVVGGISITGEGREIGTTNTKLYLNDTLGKSGVRSTMTKDDLPTLLANGVLDDADASTTHNYQQFIYLTPSDTTCTATSENYCLQFEKPGSSSSADPTYTFGRFPTSPTTSDYFYRTYVTFDKDMNGSTAVGEKIKLFGKEYTISSGTSASFNVSSAKLVLFGGADIVVIGGGETVTATVGGVTYDVTFVGASNETAAVIKVGSAQDTIVKGGSKKIGGLDIFVDNVFRLSTDDQTQNSVKVLLGSAKITLQDGSKVKLGDTEDSVDGTLVNLTIASPGKLSAFYIYEGGRSSTDDFLRLGGSYPDPVWKSFSIAFPGVDPGLTASTRHAIEVKPSGDNVLQLTFTDDRGNRKTIDWAYKSSATGTILNLSDSSGNGYVVVENATIVKDNLFTVDAGDFTHLFKLTGTSIDGTQSSNIEITDQFSGVTTKITLGPDNVEPKVIDGQTYYVNTTGTTGVKVTWGTSSADHLVGSFQTVWPRLKGKNGEFIAFVDGANSTNFDVINGTKLQLPTGAVTLTQATGGNTWTLAETTKEDGTSSSLAGAATVNLSAAGNTSFRLGRTGNGGLWYNLVGVDNDTIKVSFQGASAAAPTTNNLTGASIVLVEERDDNNDQYAVVVSASTETSGSNQVGIPAAPTFSWGAPSAQNSALGSDSTVTQYLDLWGTWVRRTTSGQDTVTLYYPDEQVIANVAVLAEGATVSTSGSASGSTVKQAVAIKTALGKLDTEVTSADRSTKNLILVGGPAVNKLVSELAAAGKTRDLAFYQGQGVGYGLIDHVASAFTSGKAALVVAGTTKADTRTVAGKLQNFDTAALTGARAEFRNGVLTTLSA